MRVKMFGASLLLFCLLITPSFAGTTDASSSNGIMSTGVAANGIMSTGVAANGIMSTGFSGVLVSDVAVLIINNVLGK